MKKKRKRQSSQKNNNCCTIIQTSYNFTTWFGMMFHVDFIHLFPSSVQLFRFDLGFQEVIFVLTLSFVSFYFIFQYICVNGFFRFFEVRGSQPRISASHVFIFVSVSVKEKRLDVPVFPQKKKLSVERQRKKIINFKENLKRVSK